MTSAKRTIAVKIKETLRAIPTSIDDLSTAIGRIFKPSDDDYPKTGAQPFSGDPPDDRHGHHS